MDYGFAHQGTIYTPNGTTGITVADNDDRNKAIEARELAQWAQAPASFRPAYYHFPDGIPMQGMTGSFRSYWLNPAGAHVSTWLGARLGVITSAHVYRHNFGGRMVAITVRGTNGAVYHGRASWDHGDIITLRKARRKGKSA